MAGVALPLRAPLSAARAAALLLLVATAGGPDVLRAQVTDASRIATFERFRAALDAGRLPEAEVHAQALVTETEEQYGREGRELVNPLSNLGTVAFRRGDYPAAEAAYQRALALIEGRIPGADRMLIRPLVGLGETLLVTDRPAEAAIALKRALDLSRNLDGLFNVEQLDIIDPLIEAYAALDRLEDAEKEHQYAFRVAESSFGRSDLRMLDPLDRLARWYEFVGRYTTARGLHARALQLADNASGSGSVEGVPGLRGLARTYYLEAVYGPEEAETATGDPFSTGPGNMFVPPPAQEGRLNPDGERALRIALEALTGATPVDRRARGETLIELADWYLIAGATGRAQAAYREGWMDLTTAGAGAVDVLRVPRRLAYRAPPTSIARLRPEDPENFEERLVELRFTVDVDGKVTDMTTASSEVAPGLERSVQFALRRARYAPRLEDGIPVETRDVTLRERLLVRTPTEQRE